MHDFIILIKTLPFILAHVNIKWNQTKQVYGNLVSLLLSLCALEAQLV